MNTRRTVPLSVVVSIIGAYLNVYRTSGKDEKEAMLAFFADPQEHGLERVLRMLDRRAEVTTGGDSV